MNLCDYCNVKPAKYTLKNGKHCCEKFWQRCSNKRLEQSFIMKEVMNRPESKERIQKLRTGAKDSEETREKKRIVLLGNTRKKGKKESLETRQKKSIAHTLKLSDYKIKHPILLKVEELREHPQTMKLQGRCKNHKCKNSKENNGWFTLKHRQIEARLRAIYYMNDGLYFYCSEKCKKECILHGLQGDPYRVKITEIPYTQEEYETCRDEVFRRANGLCEYCGEPAEHIHHIKPQKLEPFFALDPDYGLASCKKCHYKYGHKSGSECDTWNLAQKVCNQNIKITEKE